MSRSKSGPGLIRTEAIQRSRRSIAPDEVCGQVWPRCCRRRRCDRSHTGGITDGLCGRSHSRDFTSLRALYSLGRDGSEGEASVGRLCACRSAGSIFCDFLGRERSRIGAIRGEVDPLRRNAGLAVVGYGDAAHPTRNRLAPITVLQSLSGAFGQSRGRTLGGGPPAIRCHRPVDRGGHPWMLSIKVLGTCTSCRPTWPCRGWGCCRSTPLC